MGPAGGPPALPAARVPGQPRPRRADTQDLAARARVAPPRLDALPRPDGHRGETVSDQ